MLDLNTEPFIFKSHTIPEIQDELIQSIPYAAVTYKEKTALILNGITPLEKNGAAANIANILTRISRKT